MVSAVGEDEPPGRFLEGYSTPGEGRGELVPRPCGRDHVRVRGTCDLEEGRIARPLSVPIRPRRQSLRPVRCALLRETPQTPWVLDVSALPLQLPLCPLDHGPVVDEMPRPPRPRVDPVDQHVQVGVVLVDVRDDQRLVLFQTHSFEDPIRVLSHGLRGDGIGGVIADHHVERGLPDARAAGGGEGHQPGGTENILGAEVLRVTPPDSAGLLPGLPVLQIVREVGESARPPGASLHQSAPPVAKERGSRRGRRPGVALTTARSSPGDHQPRPGRGRPDAARRWRWSSGWPPR